MRVIKSFKLDDKKAIVKYASDYEEYVVELWHGASYQEAADYFTSDKQDAFDTALAMIKA